jgi:hypothetical protein
MRCEAVYRHLCRAGLVIAASMLLWGCAPAKGPFLIVQMCLANKEGVAEFIDELKAIAAAEHMSFTDRSSDTKRELGATGYSSPDRAGGSPVISIGLIGKEGLGIGAGNLGLPGYQVAVGFSGTSNQAESDEFANRVIKRLEQHWHVAVVPAGTGAKPMAGCQ